LHRVDSFLKLTSTTKIKNVTCKIELTCDMGVLPCQKGVYRIVLYLAGGAYTFHVVLGCKW